MNNYKRENLTTYFVMEKRRLDDQTDREHEAMIMNAITTGVTALGVFALAAYGNNLMEAGEALKSHLLMGSSVAMGGFTCYSALKLSRNINKKADLKIEEEELEERIQQFGISIDDIEKEGRVR